MNKLLRANFYELFRSKFFYITMGICAIVGAFFSIAMYLYPSFNFPESADIVIDKSNVLSLTPSFAAFVLPFANASTVALLMESQYNHGTIRNKLISGHTRTEVYLSGLVTICVPAVIYFVMYQLFSMGSAVLIFGYENYDLKASLVSLSVMLLMTLCISSVLSFVIGNILRGGKMAVILLCTQYAMTITMIAGMYNSDNKIIDMILRIFPQSYLFNFSYSVVPEKIYLNVVISLIMITVLTVFGVTNFKNCDIK